MMSSTLIRVAGAQEALPRAQFWTLALGSVGVVYGDIAWVRSSALRERH